jgi:ATP-binding cassette subfamily G (WHITE) protein 2 (PDR)
MDPGHASLATIRQSETCAAILDIIFEYSLHKFDNTMSQLQAGRPKFLSVIQRFVAADTKVDMCLPAFPFKSANKQYKVFGLLPDKAEELALTRLESICQRIDAIYPPGAMITIISDGLVYNGRSHMEPSDSSSCAKLLTLW